MRRKPGMSEKQSNEDVKCVELEKIISHRVCTTHLWWRVHIWWYWSKGKEIQRDSLVAVHGMGYEMEMTSTNSSATNRKLKSWQHHCCVGKMKPKPSIQHYVKINESTTHSNPWSQNTTSLGVEQRKNIHECITLQPTLWSKPARSVR